MLELYMAYADYDQSDGSDRRDAAHTARKTSAGAGRSLVMPKMAKSIEIDFGQPFART